MPDLEIIHTPGHSPGSIMFLYKKKFLFTGDSLAFSPAKGHLKMLTEFNAGRVGSCKPRAWRAFLTMTFHGSWQGMVTGKVMRPQRLHMQTWNVVSHGWGVRGKAERGCHYTCCGPSHVTDHLDYSLCWLTASWWHKGPKINSLISLCHLGLPDWLWPPCWYLP